MDFAVKRGNEYLCIITKALLQMTGAAPPKKYVPLLFVLNKGMVIGSV